MRGRAWMKIHHSRGTASASGMQILTAASIEIAGRRSQPDRVEKSSIITFMKFHHSRRTANAKMESPPGIHQAIHRFRADQHWHSTRYNLVMFGGSGASSARFMHRRPASTSKAQHLTQAPKTDPDFELGEFYIVKLPFSLLTRIQIMSDISKEYMGAAVQKSAQEFVAAGDILRAWAADTTSTATQIARLEAACNKYAKGGDAYAKAGAILKWAKRDAKDCEKMDLD
ncbi:hypothetical protein C8R43DRAFT_1141931 [Mycena crocata]|nr:hypothetical protein C8R43DRAFT_1141931 [Mycena crocata]